MKYIIKINRFGIDEIIGVYHSKNDAYKRYKSLRIYYGNKYNLKVQLERYC